MPGLKDLTVATATSSRGGSALDVFDRKDPFRPTRGSAVRQGRPGRQLGVLRLDRPERRRRTVRWRRARAVAGGSGGTGGGGSPDSPGSDHAGTKPAPFTYVADVKFGRSDRKLRTYRGLRRLEMLPSSKSPLLIFLGTEADGGNAVFLVDSTLRTSGEGNCEPSRNECATLTHRRGRRAGVRRRERAFGTRS